MSWGVRRIEDESTDPAYGGGRRSAMTVGEWLDSVSSNPRGRAPAFTGNDRSEPSSTNSLDTLDRKLAELNRRLKRLSETSKAPSRDRRPDRDSGQTSKRYGRDRSSDERDMRRDDERDPVSERLDQIDRRLAEIGKSPRDRDGESDSYGMASRTERSGNSDAERLRQGLREIERLQATLLEGLNARGNKAGHALERHLHEDRERSQRHSSVVAETIARLETEVRGLRQSVENRLEPHQPAFDDSDIQDMRRMLARLSEVSTERQESAQIDRLFDEMNRLRDLVIETGTKAVGASSAKSAQEMRLADMVERLASVATSAQEKTTDDMRSLDRRLADVADRMAELEGRGASNKDITELQRAIGAIAAKLDRPASTPKPVIPAGLLDLDIRIEKLGEKLDRLDPNPAAPRQIAALETEIAALRLDLAQSVGSRSTAKLEEQIGTLGDRIERLTQAAASGSPKSASLEKFEARISDLVNLLDRMVGSETTLDKNVDALQAEVAALRRDLSNLSGPARNPALEEQMRLLAERLESAGSQGSDPRVLAKIDEKIGRLTDLLNSDLRKPADTGGIEAKLGKLETLLADRREDALTAASTAAREAVREFASFAADSRQSDAGIRAFEEDLRQVQESARSTESRTSDALQSVHDALTAIVSRLGTIERAPIQVERAPERVIDREPVERGYPEQLSPNRPAAPQMPAEPQAAQSRSAPQSDFEPTLPVPPPKARPVEPAMAEDHRPLEPGSGKPRSAPAYGAATSGPAAPRAPQSAPVPQMPRPASAAASAYSPAPGAVPVPEAEAAPKRNDFIAAARRAAQAASQSGPGAPPPVPGERMAPAAFQNDADEEPAAKKSLLGGLFKGKQKTLVLAGIGIAAAATTAAFVTSSVLRSSSVDSMPTASISSTASKPASTPVTTAQDAAAIALTPPSSVTATFSQPATSDAARQAALADALKQAAVAQGIKPTTAIPQKSPDPATPVRQVLPESNSQPMPQPVVTALADGQANDPAAAQAINKATAQVATNTPVALAPEKVGSLALRTAAANGNSNAQFEVGMRFSEGRGVPADMHEASIWFERAASHGFLPAAYRLGSAYEKGLGIDRNPVEAKRWYKVAAEGGNIRAMHNLGVLYANDRDMPSALPWFQKAAESGLKDSQFNLGIVYALGSGVKQDLAVSYKWFALGANQGDQEAAKKRDDIATHLDHTQLAAAKLAVSTWKPMPISRDANEETAVWSEPAATASAQTSASLPAAPPPPNGWTKVMQAQAALQGKGLYAGKIDGELSPETKAAIKAFQKRAGFRQSGEIDPAFMNAVVAKQM